MSGSGGRGGEQPLVSPQPPDIWAENDEGNTEPGLWRLSTRSYFSVVGDWGKFFRCGVDLQNILEEGGRTKPVEWGEEDDDLSSNYGMVQSSLTFSGRFLPEIWNERPWTQNQFARGIQLGVTKMVLLVELDEKICKPSLPPAGVSLIDIDEAEKLITRASRRNKGAEQFGHDAMPSSPSRPQGEEEGGGDKSRQQQQQQNNSSNGTSTSTTNSSSSPHKSHIHGLLVFWKASATDKALNEDVITTLLETTKYTERIMDFLLKRDDRDERPTIAFVTPMGARRTLANVLATALAILYIIRAADVPICLYEAILHVKRRFPDAMLTRQTVERLSILKHDLNRNPSKKVN